MNDNNEFKMICSRCGAEMKSNSRYCMKCGNLNYDHEANQGMKDYMKAGATETYQVGSGKFIVDNNTGSNKNQLITSVANNTGNRAICFLVNFLAYIVVMALGFYASVKDMPLSIDLIINSYFPYICMGVSFIFLYIYSIQLIFIKCNKRWWSALVPIYSNMVFGEIVFNNKLLGLLTLIPILGQIITLVMIYLLARKFNYKGILVILLLLIFPIIIGFGSHLYENHIFVDDDSNKSVERDYKYRKIFLIFSIPFLIIGFVLVFRLNLSFVKEGGKAVNDYYFVIASKKTVNKVKGLVNNGYISCPDSDYKKNSGVYYLYFADIGKFVWLPFYHMRDVISGYVKIDNTSGSSKYYISIGDGNFGFKETLIDKVNKDTVVEYKDIPVLGSDTYNLCTREKSKYAR